MSGRGKSANILSSSSTSLKQSSLINHSGLTKLALKPAISFSDEGVAGCCYVKLRIYTLRPPRYFTRNVLFCNMIGRCMRRITDNIDEISYRQNVCRTKKYTISKHIAQVSIIKNTYFLQNEIPFFLQCILYVSINLCTLLRSLMEGRSKWAWPLHNCSISGLVRAQSRERLALSSVIPSVPRRVLLATSYKVLNFALVTPMFGIAHAHCYILIRGGEVKGCPCTIAARALWIRCHGCAKTNSASLMVRMRAFCACVTLRSFREFCRLSSFCVFWTTATEIESEGKLLPN